VITRNHGRIKDLDFDFTLVFYFLLIGTISTLFTIPFSFGFGFLLVTMDADL